MIAAAYVFFLMSLVLGQLAYSLYTSGFPWAVAAFFIMPVSLICFVIGVFAAGSPTRRSK